MGPGDEVLIPDPSFVCYGPLTTLTGATPVSLATYEKDEFRLTAEELEKKITPNSKVLLLPYPNNPTGGIMRKEDYEPIAEVVKNITCLYCVMKSTVNWFTAAKNTTPSLLCHA